MSSSFSSSFFFSKALTRASEKYDCPDSNTFLLHLLNSIGDSKRVEIIGEMARPASQTWGITGERNDTWNRVSARDYPRLSFEIKISYALEPISSVEPFDGTKNHSIGFPWENIIARKKRKLSLPLSARSMMRRTRAKNVRRHARHLQCRSRSIEERSVNNRPDPLSRVFFLQRLRR